MAGAIDQLNFEVILDDKKFTASIEADLKRAKALNKELSTILNLKSKLDRDSTQQLVNAEKVRQAQEKTTQEKHKTALAEEKVRTQTEKTAAAARSHANAVHSTNTALTSTTGLMRTLSMLTGATFSVVGLRRFLSTLTEITGQFEVQRMALRSLLKDVDGADKIFQDLYQFSSDSTYRFSELAKYAKQLAGFQIGKDNLLETTKMLGDVASGVGVSMDRLILAYGHVKSSGFLRGIQLRSFAQNGVPILEELSKMFTEIEGKIVSVGDVFDKMTKRQIPFEMVEEAFRRMTGEGGQFYKMQEVLAKTLAGQINILKGRWENLLAAIGEANSGVLKGTVDTVSRMVSSMENFGRALTAVGVAIGSYQLAMITAVALTDGLAAALNVGLLGAIKKLTLWMMKNPFVLIATAVAGLSVALYQLVTATDDATKILETGTNGINNFTKALTTERGELERLYQRMLLAKAGTEEYDRAKSEMYSRFGPYIQELQAEGVAVNNLADLYQNLNEKIADSLKARFLESETKNVTKAYDDAVNNIYESFKKTAEKNNWGIREQEDIWRYIVTGELTHAENRPLLGVGKGYIGWEGTWLYKDLGKSANELRSDMVLAQNALDTARDAFAEVFGDGKKSGGGGGVAKEYEGWRKMVKDVTDTLDPQTLKATDLAFKEDEEYYDYLERVGKKYKEINEEKDKALKADKKEKEVLLDAIKSVDNALEGNILKDVRYTRTPWTGGGSSDPLTGERNSTKARIAVLEKYKAAMDKLEPYFGGDTSKTVAKLFGGDAKDYENLDEQIAKLVAHLRTLGKEGDEAADAIEARLGTDAVSKLIKAQEELKKHQKALEKVQKELRRWEKDWGGNYSGFNGDVEKAFFKYTNEDKKIEEEYAEALKEAAEVYKDDAEGLKKYTDELERYYKVRKAANFNSGQNAIDDLAAKYVKSETSGMSLKDWGDKSIMQVFNIWKLLSKMGDSALFGDLDIDENLTAKIQEAGFTLEDFAKLTHDEFARLSREAQEELLKKVGNVVREVASDFNNAASAVRDFAEASGNKNLAASVDEIMAIGDAVSSIASRALKGDWIGAATAGLSAIIKSIFAEKTAVAELEAKLASAREEARANGMSEALSAGASSIFGTDDLRKAQNAMRLMSELQRSMSKYSGDIGSMKFNGRKWGFWEGFWSSTERAARGEKFHQESLGDLAKSVGGELYDAYGNLNADTLQKILDTYENLDAAQREWIEVAINDSKAYADAMEQLDSVIEGIFGDMASNAADKIVDSWWEAGQAALDYADILDDVAKSYAKLLVKQMLLDNAFDEHTQGALREAFRNGDATGAMAIVAEAMERAEQMLPVAEKTLEAFEPYINRNGDSSSSSGTVGSGIKSITEETANLLASYINAIRADVSVMRGLQEKGFATINAFGDSLPTLNDYIAQIAATNFDIAQSNQSILSELRSVIGSPGTSGMVVRVEYA